jgi:hypothetical protein
MNAGIRGARGARVLMVAAVTGMRITTRIMIAIMMRRKTRRKAITGGPIPVTRRKRTKGMAAGAGRAGSMKAREEDIVVRTPGMRRTKDMATGAGAGRRIMTTAGVAIGRARSGDRHRRPETEEVLLPWTGTA